MLHFFSTKGDGSMQSKQPSTGSVNRRDFLHSAAVASAGAAALLYGGRGALAAASGPTIEFLSIQQANTSWPQNLAAITTEYAKTHRGTKFVNDYTPQTSINQKIQLLAAQNALPVLYNTPAIDTYNQLIKQGEVLDLEATLKQLGAFDAVVPGAVSIMKKIYNNRFNTLPFELNIEGFWYNKQIFKANGITPPATWDDLGAIAAKLQGKGIQPFSASGLQGWPLTRLIGNYLFRKYGPGAMDAITSGKAKLTYPGYVAAAQAVADLGKKGYFGPGVATLDYTPAEDVFLQGKAAMFYMGSWALRDYTNASMNKIGASNVGFFHFPVVTGGAGNASQTPMNGGQPTSVNKQKYTPQVGQWLAYMAQHYGDTALSLQGAVTGFVVRQHHANVDPLTTMVIKEIAQVKQPVLWFEAAFSAKATTLSQQDSVPLVTGAMSASDFMAAVQKAL
jgi:raffinose/stachyose/melibiose transport system substrate-binding protein